ncbi:hypothetical protein MPSEU_000494200 [Mayamaea pseudoterrestris]|nr:hypothetical protein MPSEU_000494200 [Mayamaea pseudoterrestris]
MPSESALAKSLLDLGDPSGRQDGQYWDEWFRLVCCESSNSHRPFEWYTSPEQVKRVISFHMKEMSQSLAMVDQVGRDMLPRQMIHPGSGTSLVPLALSEEYPEHRHVVVEVSPVAIQEMKEFHEKQILESRLSHQVCLIDYVLADLLDASTPLDLPPLSFDAWIDKGLIDAVFSNKDHDRNRVQAKYLFQQAHYLLTDFGIMLIVSVAERHSLELVLENWMTTAENGDLLWATLHIWEMEPVSGEMLPFGFVLIKSSLSSTMEHSASGSARVVIHPMHGMASALLVTTENAIETVVGYIACAREAYIKTTRASKDKRLMLTTLDLKPYDAETDLVALSERIRTMQWQAEGPDGLQKLRPVWQTFYKDGVEQLEEIIPIAFGISKLRLQCIIRADDLELLVSAINDWEGDDIMEGVQSVDVDWETSAAIADVAAFVKDRR